MGILKKAPAKLNLHLEITGIREDGYHSLQSLFVPIDLTDELYFTFTEKADMGCTLSCTLLGLDTPDNLIYKAYQSLERYLPNPRPGCHIHCIKHIPTGAGLGGGSSDAACTLKGLLELYGVDIPQEELHSIATRLGADVPFFLQHQACWVEGIGEQLTPLPWFPELPCLLVLPEESISTAWAYQQIDRLDYEPVFLAPIEPVLSDMDSFCMYAKQFVNRFELVVHQYYPKINKVLTWLGNQPEIVTAHLTGSGSGVYAIVRSKTDLLELATRLAREYPDLKHKTGTLLNSSLDV